MTSPAVPVPSVPAIRSAWRTRAGQLRAQVARFVRILAPGLVLAALHALVTGSVPLPSWLVPIVLAVGPTLEVAWRQAHPAITASDVPTAPGVVVSPTDNTGRAVDYPVDPPDAAEGPAGLLDGVPLPDAPADGGQVPLGLVVAVLVGVGVVLLLVLALAGDAHAADSWALAVDSWA